MAIHATRVIELISSTQRTATANGDSNQVGALLEGRAYINITALSGTDTPTLTVTIQDSPDATVWYTHTASTGLTSTGQTPINLTNFGLYIRARCVISGTFSAGQGITFDIQFTGKS